MAFDDNGDRMFAEYEVINVRDHQRKKIVGKLLYDTVCRIHLFFLLVCCMPIFLVDAIGGAPFRRCCCEWLQKIFILDGDSTVLTRHKHTLHIGVLDMQIAKILRNTSRKGITQ